MTEAYREPTLPDVPIKDLKGRFSFEAEHYLDAGDDTLAYVQATKHMGLPAYWEDEDGITHLDPGDITPEINLLQAMVISILIAGIVTYAVLAWWF
jgi:hypothetical protein